MRLRLALAITAIPIAIGSYIVACTPDPPLDNLCGWIGDPNNCYRAFATDVQARCGAFVDPTTSPAPPNTLSPRHGSFLKRDKLDLCVFDSAAGGQVVFDPALDLTQFPVTKTAFIIKNGNNTLCGAGAVDADGAFAVSVEANPPIADGGGGGPDCSSEAQICGGTFSLASVTDRELADAKCPSGASLHFNRLQLAKCDGDPKIEDDLEQLMPRAELLSDPGSVGDNGYIRFRVYYPPTTALADGEKLSGKDPVVVEYFECSIPGADPTCANGVQDDSEPDVDCGAICGKGCDTGKPCYVNADCQSRNCEAVNGILTCTANPLCGNGVPDPGEGGVDCGYFCTTKCAACTSCNIDADCDAGLSCIGDALGNNRYCRADADAGCSMPSDAGGGAGGSGGAGGAGGSDAGP